MPIKPNDEQLKRFIKNVPSGPLTMLNLLEFKEKAVYADGRESNLSGREAYELYGIEMEKMLEPDGGRILFSAATNTLVIGEGELEWDMVAIAEYASLESFQKITSSPEYQEIAKHREAGLAHQLLINLK
jgi:uncharacterized protein (DUF1330 family)